MNKTHRRLALVLALIAIPAARGLTQPAIPEALEPWRDWVLFGQEFRDCPVLNGQNPNQESSHICAWPGELDIEVDTDGASFTQGWTLYREEWVPLPGNDRYWPVGVEIDGVAQAAVLRGGRPTVRVTAGEHQISGEVSWADRPASIPVPVETGLIGLALDGEDVISPELENGVLWLGLRPDLVVEEDRLNVEVYRVLTDTIPNRLLTRVQLDVAGQSREIELSGVMLPEFVGESLDAALPAELDADGTLRMQIRPGRWEATLIAHHPGIVSELTRPAVVAPWPLEEVWSFESIPQLRVAVLEGVPAVDSDRAGVPAIWRNLPSFAVAADDTVTIVERSRNDATDDNEFGLSRFLWLDFDGTGFTAEDRVSGQLSSEWRLDMAPPYTMTMAALGSTNLLVTEGEEPGTQGVELRSPNLALTATSRLPFAMSLPVTGYTEMFNGAQTTLFLPPAHRLVAAPGADSAAGTWIERWTLLDIFLALIIAVASWRLLGIVGGLVGLATIVLIYHEPSAPHYAWLNLLLITALVRVVPEGKIRAWCQRYRYLSIAALILILVPFAAMQLRVVLYPQLERFQLQRGIEPTTISALAQEVITVTGTRLRRDDFTAANATTVITEDDMRDLGVQSVADLWGLNTAAGSRTLTMVDQERTAGFQRQQMQQGQAELARLNEQRLSALAPSQVFEELSAAEPASRYQPGALVQTGPGLPDWGWTRYTLGFSGPIDREQSYSLLIIGPYLTGLWRVASVALALAFGWLLLKAGKRGPGRRQRPGSIAGSAGKAAAVLALAALVLPLASQAQTPDAFPPLQLLEELRTRLTENAPCHPTCAELTNAEVTVGDNEFDLAMELALQDAVAVPIPGDVGGFAPTTISVDDQPQRTLLRSRGGQAWLRLDAGVRRVELSGPIPAGDSLRVPFPLTPRRITVTAPDWDIAGVTDARLPSGTLELIRQRQVENGEDETIQATAFPPYVQVTRTLNFQLDWMVTTNVRRVAPRDGAFTIGIDLLPEESVVTENIEVEDGVATVAFAAGQNLVSWQSRLPTADAISMTARDDVPWTESWNFNAGLQWHAEYAGLPATQSAGVVGYLPRPGETLDVDLTRPEPVSGDTIAIDDVNYTRTVGDRSSNSTVAFTYRSTRASEHTIQLPPDSELESVRIDGQLTPLELDGSTLTLPVTPGQHGINIAWRSLTGTELRSEIDAIDLGAGVSNMTLSLRLPSDRWTLLPFGPTLGPAVLYWAELAVFILVAIILGKIALSPLRSHEWLLLGLGLSTFSWPVLLIFGAWAFLFSLRQIRQIASPNWLFNTGQVVLAILTVIMLITLISSIQNGLLGQPNMHIVSPVAGGSQLSWFMDRSDGVTPVAGVFSVSLWFYKAAMLAWALWLSFAVVRWLRWAWTAFSTAGLWRGRVLPGKA